MQQDSKNLLQRFGKEFIDAYNKISDKVQTDPLLYDAMIEKHPEFVPAYNNKAEILIRTNQSLPAIEILKKGLEILSQNQELSEIFGSDLLLAIRLNLAVAVKKYNGDLTQIRKILHSWPLVARAGNESIISQGSYLFGEALYLQGSLAEAIPYLEQAKTFFQKHDEASYINEWLMNAYYQTEAFDKAIPLLDKSVTKSSPFDLRQKQGLAHLRAGNFKKAEALLVDLLNDFLDQSGKREQYEKFLEELNRKKNEKAELERVDREILTLEKQRGQNNPETERELGFLYLLRGEYDKAKNFFQNALVNMKSRIHGKKR